MIAKRKFVDNRYLVSVLPEDSEDVELGIPVNVFSIFQLDLEKVEETVNDLVSQFIVKQQATPSLDTLNSILRTAFIRELNKLGELNG